MKNIKTSIKAHNIIKKITTGSGYDMIFDHKKSKGSFLYDSLSNKKYLDMFSFYASYPISYNHPDICNNEFKKYIGNIAIHNPSNSDVYTIEYANFLSKVNSMCMKDNFNKIFLISGGALAVENALKVAFDWKIKYNESIGIEYNDTHNQVIHFNEAFHGRSGYTLSLTNTDPIKYMNFPMFKEWPRIINPKIEYPITYRNMDDLQFKENMALSKIEYLLKTQNEKIACIIIEPIQGEGGDNHFRPIFWNELRTLANIYNVLLIADEIQCGVGLTGKMWAYEHYGTTPDILVFGKKMQVCGIMCTDRINKFGPGLDSNRINSTWGGNLVDMVRSTKFLEIIDKYNLVNNSAVVGKYILDSFFELQKEYHMITNLRGKGLMIAFDLPNRQIRDELIEVAFKKQLLLLPCGNKSIRLRPFLDLDIKTANLFLRILRDCLLKILLNRQ